MKRLFKPALIQNLYGSSVLQLPGTTDYATGRLTQSIATTYYPDGTSTAATQQYEYDQRGRITATNLSLSVPSSWGVTTALPTDQETQSYNDADQPMTTQTTVGGAADSTFSAAYDSTAGVQTGLSNNVTGIADLVTQTFDNHGNVGSLAFQSSSGTARAAESFTSFLSQGPIIPLCCSG